MNRKEALRALGLDEEATSDDIKAAYKETAQILHPDRFATNKKLQDRATEQFKNLQEAYEYLTSSKGSRAGSRGGARGAENYTSGGSDTRQRSAGYTAAAELEARLAGIAAAKTQLVAQRDVVYDERRNGILMAVVGAIAALLCGRKLGVLAVVAAAGVTAAVWGVVQVVSAQRTLSLLNDHITDLVAEQKLLVQQLDDLE